MTRLLCLVSAMNAGGAETFLMKIYRCLDRTKYQMDFCVNVKEAGMYDAEIESMGGRIYRIPSKSENMTEFSRQLYHVVRDNGYKNVMRVTSNAMGFYDLHIAKKAGATNCIARSSNSSDGGGAKSWLAHRIGKALFKRDVDVEIAPSDLAAIYTFGRRDYESGRVTILCNGIDFEEYRYSPESRARVRGEFNIDDDCVLLGHIGRFSEQKNHEFLIALFAEVHREYSETKLLLVGEGERQRMVKEMCEKMELTDSVIFAGVRKDVPALLSAMDLFVFPSRYEGMPNVIIEAQAAGLPCLVSDRITKEAAITSLVERIPLAAEAWEKEICGICSMNDVRSDLYPRSRQTQLPAEYDIRNVSEKLAALLV